MSDAFAKGFDNALGQFVLTDVEVLNLVKCLEILK